MSEWKTRVTAHLRAAQGWLSKAERSFDEQKEIRAELNLMLAQAELRRAQEEKRSPKTRFRYACYRQGGALLCALLLFGFGSMVWMNHSPNDSIEETSSLVQTQATQQAEPLKAEATVSQSVMTAAEAPSAPTATEKADETLLSNRTEVRYEQDNKAQRSAPAISLSREEMRQMMQAAGRSLRGQ